MKKNTISNKPKMKKMFAAVQDTKSYITHVDSCSDNIEWLN